ncbi:MAG: tRNA lysidine(34) synthetase TilS [Spirochaetaceae bacterium]|nr:tRNA lysidine(34) synthetase TilS [Spirochaetaceae bacterium]
MVKVNDSVNKENALNSFERKIIESFASAQMNSDDFFRKDKTIMFGVSGGADSVAMLIAFTEIRKKLFSDKSPEFYVVSIDHSIRPSEESAGDARYVQELCRKLDVECQVVHFPEGLVSGIASERMKGIEEAARFLRYQSFEQIAKEHNASLFCLAHNRNDQLETLLMRFLQGSDTSSSVGIPRKRGIFYRPMLDISRDEIEDYLLQHQIEYKTDSTNSDESYLRNRIRNTLIPVISQSFPGWDKAVLSGVEKKIEDNYALEQVIHNLDWDKGLNKKGNPYISVDARQFYEMLPAFRRRFIYKGLTILEVQNRIPYKVIKNAIYAIKNNSDTIPLFSFFSTNLIF